MATKQIHAKSLARLLNSAPHPVYVLDDDLTIVFLNQDCSNWLGPIAEQLPGTKCLYHTPAAVFTPETVAAGLCPPPGVIAGQDVSAVVSYYGEDSRMRRRRVWFHPFGSPPGDVIGVIAEVDTVDLPEDISALDNETGEEPRGIELHEAIRRFRQEAAGRLRADRLVGASPAMLLARHQVELAEAGRFSVLLVGPPGSGRQHLAAAIHYASPLDRTATLPAGGLIPLDCSLVAGDLILSTLAAIVRANPPGEKNRQTSILLNHVDEISAELQMELAVFLTRKPFTFRLISTARIALTELSARGQFRGDLAAILSTITIVLPPLIDRREDLPLLVQAFLEECNARGAKQVGGFTQEALDQLYFYSWPGNLDELMETTAEAHRHAAGPEIGVDDLPERLHLAAQAAAYPRRPEEKIVLDEYLGRVERELIRRALARSKGNKAKAARLLGLTRPRLYRRMVQLGLEERPKDDGNAAGSQQ
ncbi:MAG: helix-turn-helix domain-containing protein [Thermoguttaceae bacterium]|jgi:DNA-binding NtrC family response regulator